MTYQKDYWEDKKVLRRRDPLHPVIEAFALPKVKKIIAKIRKQNSLSIKKNTQNTLLDVGSGNGYFSHYLSLFFNVSSLDFSHNILSISPTKKKIQASATEIPFKSNSFDVVFCANLLHHVENPSVVIKEMIRVSSRYVVTIEPNRYNPLMIIVALLSKEDRLLLRFTSRYIAGLMRDNMEIISQEKTGFILPNKTPNLLLPILKKVEPFLFPKMYHLLIAEKK